MVEVTTPTPSPFASSLLFGYVAQFLYEGDSPLAEKRAAALTVDPTLLAELLGHGDGLALRDLLDPHALADTEAELQRLAEHRRARIDRRDRRSAADSRSADDHRGGPAEHRGRRRRRRWPSWRRRGGRSRCGSAARCTGPIPTDAAIAAGRAGHARCRRASPSRCWSRSPIRSAGCSAATPAPTVRSSPPNRPPGSASASRWSPTRCAGWSAPAGWRRASSGRSARRRSRRRLPAAAPEFVDAEVLRLLRRRSLAALRAEVEPVEPTALARFLPAWNGIGVLRGSDALRGVDGVLRAVEQLAGALLPASAVESLILPARVPGYTPALLDELTTAGEVLWTGHGSLRRRRRLGRAAPGRDAAADAPAARRSDADDGPRWRARARAPGDAGGARRRRGVLLPRRSPTRWPRAGRRPADRTTRPIADALWDLVFDGLVTSDTLAPLRARLAGGRTTHRVQGRGAAGPDARAVRAGDAVARAAVPACRPAGEPAPDAAPVAPPSVVGRWSLVPGAETDPTRAAHAAAEVLLDRHGIVTRGAVVAEGTVGGFAGVYRVLSALEETGRIRRGYFVEGLGAAQFASAGRRRPGAGVRDAARRTTASCSGGGGAGRGRPGQPVRRGAALAGAAASAHRRREPAPARPARRAGGLGGRWSTAPPLLVRRTRRPVAAARSTTTRARCSPRRPAGAGAELVTVGRPDRRRCTVAKVDGVGRALTVRGSPVVDALVARRVRRHDAARAAGLRGDARAVTASRPTADPSPRLADARG